MRVYKTKGRERKSAHIVVPIQPYIMKKLEQLAEKSLTNKTELARRFILEGLRANG